MINTAAAAARTSAGDEARWRPRRRRRWAGTDDRPICGPVGGAAGRSRAGPESRRPRGPTHSFNARRFFQSHIAPRRGHDRAPRTGFRRTFSAVVGRFANRYKTARERTVKRYTASIILGSSPRRDGCFRLPRAFFSPFDARKLYKYISILHRAPFSRDVRSISASGQQHDVLADGRERLVTGNGTAPQRYTTTTRPGRRTRRRLNGWRLFENSPVCQAVTTTASPGAQSGTTSEAEDSSRLVPI